MKLFGYNLAEIRKAVVAFIGVAVLLLTSFVTIFAEVLSPGIAGVLLGIVGFITIVSTFLVKNATLIDDLSDGKIDGKY